MFVLTTNDDTFFACLNEIQRHTCSHLNRTLFVLKTFADGTDDKIFSNIVVAFKICKHFQILYVQIVLWDLPCRCET